MITVRLATQEDVPSILGLVRSFIEGTDYARVLRFNPEQLLVLVPTLIDRHAFFVAELNAPGPLIGFIAGAATLEPIAGTKMLDELAWWVEPSYRNGRAGPKLLRVYGDWARQAGAEAMTMKEPVGTDLARFYRKAGYEPVETIWFKRL